jgi:aryl-alcohol dehydrogenase-like predicted oxidoreductase
VIAYSPMASGLLSGAYDRTRLEQLAADDRRGARADEILEVVGRLRPVAGRLGIGVGALAVAWTLAVEGVTGAIGGARRPDQVDGWIVASDVALDVISFSHFEAAVGERSTRR